MVELYERISRIKAIEGEYFAAREALGRLQSSVDNEGHHVLTDCKPKDLQSASDRLEATYLIRLWVEFETSLRSYYKALTANPVARIRAKDLIDTISARRRRHSIPEKLRVSIHKVREYRNSLIHDRDVGMAPVGLAVARRDLNTFLGKLIEH